MVNKSSRAQVLQMGYPKQKPLYGSVLGAWASLQSGSNRLQTALDPPRTVITYAGDTSWLRRANAYAFTESLLGQDQSENSIEFSIAGGLEGCVGVTRG